MKHSSLGLVVVAAGSSRRMSGVDKVWAELGTAPVVWHSLAALAPRARASVLVVHPDHLTRASDVLRPRFPDLTIVRGGADRQESVQRGLAALEGISQVAVHDAARPFVPADLLQSGVELLSVCDGAVPVVPLHDTIKRIDAEGNVLATLDRNQLRAVQTPQLFHLDVLRSAHEEARRSGTVATDDASLLEAAGYRVKTFPGAGGNFKITTADDLRLARLLLEGRVPT